MKHSDRYVRTTSLSLAVFLFSKEQKISGINPLESEQKEFVFVNDSPELEELVELYKFGSRDDDRLLVEVHRYEQARRELLDRLNE